MTLTPDIPACDMPTYIETLVHLFVILVTAALVHLGYEAFSG